MIQTPAHKQTDPNKKPGQVVYPIKQKLTFEEWADLKKLKNPSIQRDAMRLAWEAGQENK